jgi:hypothetical protein
MENLLCFRCLENLPFPHIERLHTSKFIVNCPLPMNMRFSLLLAFQQNWFHLIRSFLAKVIWFLGCPIWPQVRPGRSPGPTFRWQTGPVRRGNELLYWRVFRRRTGKFWWAARPSSLQFDSAGLTAELSSGLLPTAIFSPPINAPSSSLSQPHF